MSFSILRKTVRATGGTETDEFAAKIKSVTSSTTVASVFLYDTRSDSDGGAWRKKCAGLSWFDEDLNTATRGGRRSFPSVALIVADNGGTSNVTIYDLDDPAMPMWMVINRGSGHILFGADMGSLYALNGRLYVGHNVTAGALSEISFADDFGFVRIHNTSAYNGATIADREVRTSDTVTGTTGALVSRAVNDVAATYLEGGELDSLGLVRPVVACATAGGVSVIHPNGSVVNSSSTGAKGKLAFNENGDLAVSASGDDIVDVTRNAALYSASWTDNYRIHDAGSHARDEILITDGYSTGQNKNIAATNYGWALGKGGLTLIKLDDGNPNNSAVAVVQSTYNTGYMLGDIRFAGLANGGTSDRSVKGNHLTATGSIAGIAVATNAELVGFSGFTSGGSGNHLARGYDADFDFGTGDFSVTLWAKWTGSGTKVLVDRGSTARFLLYDPNTGKPQLYVTDGSTNASITTANVLDDGSWHQIIALRRNSKLEIYVDGKDAQSTKPTSSHNLTDTNAVLKIGVNLSNNDPFDGSLSLVRISATAPTPTQVADIYREEAKLFRSGAKCLLQSDHPSLPNTVLDLAHDKSTDLLSVSQYATISGNGISRFRGLEMVDTFQGDDYGWDVNSTNLVATSGGVSAYGRTSGTGGVIVDLPPFDVRGDTNIADSKLPDDGKFHFSGVTTNATPTVIGQIPIAENESYTVIARVMGLRYNTADSSVRHFCEIKQQFTRRIGGDVVEETQISKLEEGDWAALDVDLDYDTAADTIRVKVTGDGSGPYRVGWNAEVEVQRISEKTYER